MTATLNTAHIRLPDWLAAMNLPETAADDVACMELVLEIARLNVINATGGPFSALLREDLSGRIISVGVNSVTPSGNPVLHAEVVAISLGDLRHSPAQVTLFSSCEPCIMCLGALHWSKIGRVIYSARQDDAQAIGFDEGAGCPELKAQMVDKGVTFQGGLLRDKGAEVLRFYKERGGVIYGPTS